MSRRRPKLHADWKRIVLHSWSFRINVAIALTSAFEAAVEYIVDGKLGSAVIVAGASAAASAARLLKQVAVSGPDED